MSRKKPAVEADIPVLDAEKVLALNTMLLVRAEQNPGDCAFVVRVARAIGLPGVVREVNRLQKFAQRKVTAADSFGAAPRRRARE